MREAGGTRKRLGRDEGGTREKTGRRDEIDVTNHNALMTRLGITDAPSAHHCTGMHIHIWNACWKRCSSLVR